MKKSVAGLQGPFDGSDVGPWRACASALLRSTGLRLARLARQLRAAGRGRRQSVPAELEFYAEAGAPEGALYLNGEYVGRIPGVTRL